MEPEIDGFQKKPPVKMMATSFRFHLNFGWVDLNQSICRFVNFSDATDFELKIVHLELLSLKLTYPPENRPGPKRKVIFQPSIFRCYGSFREGMPQGLPFFFTLIFQKRSFLENFICRPQVIFHPKTSNSISRISGFTSL